MTTTFLSLEVLRGGHESAKIRDQEVLMGLVACSACGGEVSESAVACPKCGHPTGAAKHSEMIGVIALLVPLASTALLWLWVAEMNLFQRPDQALAVITIGTVIITAILVAVEAGKLGASAATWFVAVCLAWIIAFPMWLLERGKRGAANLVVGGLIVALIFGGSAGVLYYAIEGKKTEIRERLSHLSTPAAAARAEPQPEIAPTETPPVITAAAFAALKNGMSYKKAVEIIGSPGEERSRNQIAGYTTFMVAWQNSDGSNAIVMFQNGRLMTKAQLGLR